MAYQNKTAEEWARLTRQAERRSTWLQRELYYEDETSPRRDRLHTAVARAEARQARRQRGIEAAVQPADPSHLGF